MKLAFLGTPEVAAGTLRALVGAGHDVLLVVTRPDTRRGRGPGQSPSPVKEAAVALGLPVSHRPADVTASGAELAVVVVYGRLIKPEVLAEVPMLNVHFSLLPRWRGAAPVERALLAGDAETGVCLMALEEGLDTGPVYDRAVTPIGPDETADDLRRRLGEIGNELLIARLSAGLGEPRPQTGEPTYAAKLEPAELYLDFSRAAEMCNRQVRVGRAWTTWRGRRLLVHRAGVVPDAGTLLPGEVEGDRVGTGEGALELIVVQPEGKPAMSAADWWRGACPLPGERLGEQGGQLNVSEGRTTARGVAISALMAAEEGERANLVLPRMLSASGLDERDRGFATELAYGALRMCRACDWLVGQFAKGDLEPAVRAAARAGAYQLAFMRVPAYAAVSATVAECPPRARPLLNAVLRRIADLVAGGQIRWPGPGTKLSYPDWVLARLGEDLGAERALAALQQMNQAASPSTRPDGYIQDAGSQALGEYVAGLLAGLQGPVLDLCAAPGGKTTFLAHGSSFVVGADVAPARATLVAGNAARLQLANVAVVVADGTQPPFREENFAGVLVDAPCSGLGVLRRRPDARWRARPEDVRRLASLQKRLLSAAAPLVALGGVLVYSVCTLTRRETLDIDKWTAGGLAGEWEAAPPPGPPWEPLGRGALLLPQAAGTDGMYVLALYRRH